MTEMTYGRERKNPVEVLASGFNEGYYYVILNLGTHPTAYVKLPSRHPLYKKFYDEANVLIGEEESPVHGPFTYSGELALAADFDTPLEEGWYLGWDYWHAGDWSGTLDDETNIALNYKKYTLSEILEDCNNAIDWLIKQEKGFTKCEKMGGKNLTKCDKTEEKLTADEVLEAAKIICQTLKDIIEATLEGEQHGFVFRKISGNDAHTFSLIKTRDDQEIMIVSKEFAEDIRGKYE